VTTAGKKRHCRSLSLPVHDGLTRLLVVFLATGLAFMLLPGTFVGVMNLIAISSRHVPGSGDAGWIQAHGQAQIFGWLGTFILGISLYVIPKMRLSKFSFPLAWSCWGAWTAGTFCRWLGQMYDVAWQQLLPAGTALQLIATVLFIVVIFRRAGTARQVDPWFAGVAVGVASLMVVLSWTLLLSLDLAATAGSPVHPKEVNNHLLTLSVWGFLVPVVWGYSARWLAPFVGLKSLRTVPFFTALLIAASAVALSISGQGLPAAILVVVATAAALGAFRLLEPAKQDSRTRGVHPSFPTFVRLAYGWLAVAAGLNVWAALAGSPAGIVGASRHAITVGFFSTMVFAIGPRVLPAFAGMRQLYSARLMFAALATLTIGCSIRVVMQILAYQGYASFAWKWLPVSALTEMAAMTLFAVNMAATLLQRPTAIGVAVQLREAGSTA
jgi:uncharacterized protein involved in response to NO